MGVGSTGVAAKELNRNYVGCEIDPIFFEAAKSRIEMTEVVTKEDKENV